MMLHCAPPDIFMAICQGEFQAFSLKEASGFVCLKGLSRVVDYALASAANDNVASRYRSRLSCRLIAKSCDFGSIFLAVAFDEHAVVAQL